MTSLADDLRHTERRRLRSLVDVNLDEAEALHAPDFELVHPSGGVWSRERYLGGIALGDIDYRRFEPISPIEVMVAGDLAVLRYKSSIEIAVAPADAGSLTCWHMDSYRLTGEGWRVCWSQATSVAFD